MIVLVTKSFLQPSNIVQVGFLKRSLNVTRFESKRFTRIEGHYLSLAWEETKSKQTHIFVFLLAIRTKIYLENKKWCSLYLTYFFSGVEKGGNVIYNPFFFLETPGHQIFNKLYGAIVSYLKVRQFFKIGGRLVSIVHIIFHFSWRKLQKSFHTFKSTCFTWHEHNQEPELRVFVLKFVYKTRYWVKSSGQNWDNLLQNLSSQIKTNKWKQKYFVIGNEKFLLQKFFKCSLRWKLQSQSLRTIIIFEWRNSSSLEEATKGQKTKS